MRKDYGSSCIFFYLPHYQAQLENGVRTQKSYQMQF
jgi:hypothetical protein